MVGRLIAVTQWQNPSIESLRRFALAQEHAQRGVDPRGASAERHHAQEEPAPAPSAASGSRLDRGDHRLPAAARQGGRRRGQEDDSTGTGTLMVAPIDG